MRTQAGLILAIAAAGALLAGALSAGGEMVSTLSAGGETLSPLVAKAGTVGAGAVGAGVVGAGVIETAPLASNQTGDRVSGPRLEVLPGPERSGGAGLFGLLQSRRSVRDFTGQPLTPAEIGQLLWAGHGTTGADRFTHHTIPSAGALYPIELFLVDDRGVARYDQSKHALAWQTGGDHRADLARACLGQTWAAGAPALIAVVGVPDRTTVKYGDRGHRYMQIEAGCALQNLLLAATELGLGGTPIGAFHDEDLADLLQLPPDWEPLLVVPVGHEAP